MLVGFLWGLYLIFFENYVDYQQRETVNIMYLHVPSAWMCMSAYALMAVASAVSLIWRHPLADLTAKATAPIGMAFTALALITGSLWGKPMWGTWWEWDGRMTSVLVLFFLYMGYVALWQAIDNFDKAAKAAAILALVGVINLPIIKFSVEWWNTLHQPASFMRSGGMAVDWGLMGPMVAMLVAFNAYYVTVLLWRMKAELMERRIQAMSMTLAAGK